MQEADITKVAPEYVGETAFPTVTFAALTLLAYILGFVAAITGAIPLWLGFVVLSYLIFMSFTPLHESVHRNIGGRHKGYFWLNDLVGYSMATLLGFSFTAYKWAHKVHHQNTNESHKDPDHVFGGNKMHDARLGCLLLVFNEYKMF
jgi:beta-carotene hydroxylase